MEKEVRVSLGNPARKRGYATREFQAPNQTLPGQLVFLPLPTAPPIKAVTPRRVERKPRLPDQKISQDRSIPAPLLPGAGHRGVRFDWDRPPPPRKHQACARRGRAPALAEGEDGGMGRARGAAQPQRPPKQERRRARRRRRDSGARAGACPPATRRGVCEVGEGCRSVGVDGRCKGGGLAAGGCAGGGKTGRGLDVRERMGVGLPWGVSAGEGHVWI